MTVSVGVLGVTKTMAAPSVGVLGVTKTVIGIWAGVGGTPKKVWPDALPNQPNIQTVGNPFGDASEACTGTTPTGATWHALPGCGTPIAYDSVGPTITGACAQGQGAITGIHSGTLHLDGSGFLTGTLVVDTNVIGNPGTMSIQFNGG